MALAMEFQYIEKYFQNLAGPQALSLKDDAALLSIDPDKELVITTDAMVENVHFFSQDPVDFIARKLLRCNLSDLAAMGAIPKGYFLTLSLPKSCFTHEWFSAFTKGLSQDQNLFHIFLWGGDTTSNPHNMVFSVTMLGEVKKGRALRRQGARAGDGIWVSGTIGDAALGLLSLKNVIEPNPYLINRYYLPQPRTGLNLDGIASAAMDISDGLVQDLEHLARASKVGAMLYCDDIPLSIEAKKLGKYFLKTCVTGGDDYELLFTVPVDKEEQARHESNRNGIQITKIGQCIQDVNCQVRLYDSNHQIISLDKTGWSHI